jgi:hypothetical protein
MTTTQSNYLTLTEAITILHEALRPFVEQQLKGTGGGWWKHHVLPNLSPLSRAKLPDQAVKGKTNNLAPLDVADLLQLIIRNWAVAFRGRLSDAARAYAQELYDTRNLWAHKGEGDLSRPAVDRALDTAALLLEGIDRKAAARIRELRERAPESTPAAHRAGAGAAAQPPDARTAQRAEARPAPATQGTLAATPIGEAAPADRGAPQPAAVAGLRSWREVATPRADVRAGTLSQGQFAADLAEVARGNRAVGSEYLDPVEFFDRTYVTAGVRAFLKTALLRLAGRGGDAVVQLKTGFGGGKTHTMLALYHLAKSSAALADHPALRDLFAEVGGPLPNANVAVLVGTHIDATTPFDDDPELRSLGIELRTLWGRMAWQLGRFEGYRMVQEADEQGIAPGAETLSRLFTRFAPCVVLIDELVAFARNLPTGRARVPAGSFESNLTFIQALTEAARNTPRTIIAASIPESDMEIGGMAGQQVLRKIENTFGRVETPWTPVEATESFEVVRRRLFESVDQEACDQAVSAFSRLYRDNPSEFPPECRERAYEERMRRAFPFHPELFDRLYEDWNAAIPNFQSTRGVLRLLAGAVQWLWQRGDPSPMIMPGTLPLESPTVRDEVMRYLDRGFQPVIESDIDGAGAEATQIDAANPRFGRVAAARAVARTIFLGSVPGKATTGIEDTRIRLGAVRPGESVSTYNDALGRLNQRLQFLYGSGSGRYWFEVRPNLTRTASDRMSRYTEADVFDLLESRLKADKDNGVFAGKHVAPADTGDVPDDTSVRLVLIPPRHPYQSGSDEPPAVVWAKRLLDTRGSAPRLNRNMLVFAALDDESLPGLIDQSKQFLAWDSIVRDRAQLNLDANQVQQATTNRDTASAKIDTDLKVAYRWALAPGRTARQVDGRWTSGEEEWRAIDTAQRGMFSLGGVAQRVGDALQAEERLLTAWSPMFLTRELERWFWSQGLEHLSVKKLWEENLTRYLYFPRLANRDVLAKAITEGATSRDFFGYAAGVGADGRYLGLHIGRRPGAVLFDAESVLVRREVALRQVETETPIETPPGPRPGPDGGGGPRPPAPPQAKKTTRFYGSVKLNTLKLASSAGQIGDEIVKHLAGLVDADVDVVLEVRAHVRSGIPDAVQRTVGENAKTLKFQTFEFEEE